MSISAEQFFNANHTLNNTLKVLELAVIDEFKIERLLITVINFPYCLKLTS